MTAYTPMPALANRGPTINLRRREHLSSPITRGAGESTRLVFWGQWAIATALHLAVLLAVATIEAGEVSSLYRIAGIVAAVFSVPVYSSLGVYRLDNGYAVGLARLLLAWCLLVGVLAFFALVTKTTEIFQGNVALSWILGGFSAQALSFLPLHYAARRWGEKMKRRRRSLIVGTGPLAQNLAAELGEPLVGMVEADDHEVEFRRTIENGPFTFRCVGQVAHLRSLIRELRINRVYVALPAAQADQIEGLYVDLLDANVDVVWVPDVGNLLLLNHSTTTIGQLPAVNLNECPLTARPGSALLKSIMDRGLALLGLLALSPLMIAIAVAVKLSSPGPVLFAQQRHGWNGKVFELIKFRSMRVHDDHEVKQATRDDPRVTTVGRILRRTSLDELPQLINVIKGDMSLVGPRPHAIAHNDYYSDKIKAYMARHRIKPGISGYAQIKGYRGETDTLDKMERRVELDLEYINNWSLWLDIKILLKTPLSLFSKHVY